MTAEPRSPVRDARSTALARPQWQVLPPNFNRVPRSSDPSEKKVCSEVVEQLPRLIEPEMAMRCALLVLVALLKVPALRTEPLEPSGDKDADPRLQPRPLGEAQLWSQQAPQEALARILAEGVDDDAEDLEYPAEYEQFMSLEQLDDAQLARLSSHLLKVLQRPGAYEAPVLLVREAAVDELDEGPYPLELDDLKSVAKRSRYYRRYPWKRQNSRTYQSTDYDPYNPCTLTRKEVFKLLVALHDARQGNKSRVVNFCNRKRPASAVYTNIRFLGRRRK